MSSQSGRSFLVTGAAGFIGSHAAIRLLERGDHVVGLDNFNDYYDPARKRANLADVQRVAQEVGKLTFVEGDIRDRGSLVSVGAAFRETRLHWRGIAFGRAMRWRADRRSTIHGCTTSAT